MFVTLLSSKVLRTFGLRVQPCLGGRRALRTLGLEEDAARAWVGSVLVGRSVRRADGRAVGRGGRLGCPELVGRAGGQSGGCVKCNAVYNALH